MKVLKRRLIELWRAPRDRETPSSRGLQRGLRWLALIATVVMCLVLLQGTLVTNSGSAAGCGNTWPLCHGKIIPEFSGLGGAATVIEFSHRAVVPVESTLILALAAGMLWLWRDRREAQLLAPTMIFFLFLQAVLGGLAVMFPTSAGVLAAHFGISLMAFASLLLAACFVLEMGGADRRRDLPMPSSLRAWIWGSLIYTYVVVYLGAYVRHVGASLACLDWPLCNGAVVPRFVEGVGAQYTHRVAAFLLTLVICWLYIQARRVRDSRPDIYWGSLIALLLVILQALSGGIVVVTRLTILSTLLHSFLITLLFGTQSYLWLHTLRRPAAVRATERMGDRHGTAAVPRTAQAGRSHA